MKQYTIKDESVVVKGGNNTKGVNFLVLRRFVLASDKIDFFFDEGNSLFEQCEFDFLQRYLNFNSKNYTLVQGE